MNKYTLQQDKSLEQFPDLSARIIPDIPEFKWKEIIQEQEYHNYFCQIRKEIITRAFDKISQNLFDQQLIAYLVDCVYESLQQIIKLHFLFYDPSNEYYAENSSWSPDLEPEPCKYDSWSRGFITTEKPEIKVDIAEKMETVLSDYQLLKLNVYPRANAFALTEQVEIPEPSPESLHEVFVKQFDPIFSDFNVTFTCTTPATSTDALSSGIFINKVISDSKLIKKEPSRKLFYKNVRSKMTSAVSLLSDIKIFPRRKLPTFKFAEPSKKLNLLPLRLNVISQVRQPQLSLRESRTVRTGTRSRDLTTEYEPSEETD